MKNQQQQESEALVRSLIPGVVILPSTTSSSYDNQEDHMRALDFHMGLRALQEMADTYGLKIKVLNAEDN